MIIGIDASRANRPRKSGTEWYSYHLIRELARLDSENQYILYSDQPLSGGLANLTLADDQISTIQESDPKFKFEWQEIKSPHNNFRAKILAWPFNFLWTQGRLSLEMLFRSPDILFIPAHVLPVFHPKKSVVTIHDVGFARDSFLYDCHTLLGPTGKKRSFLISWIIRVLTRGQCNSSSLKYLDWSTEFSLKNAKKVITISNFSKREILSVYGNKYADKIQIIHNGYSQKYHNHHDKQQIKKVLSEYGLDDQLYIFYIGRIERKKNTHGLIEAFALLRGSHKDIKHKLVLVGSANYGYDEMKYLISEFGLDEDVIMPGWAREEDVPFLMAGADLFVFPSFYEGFGIPLLQSMASGVPIVASMTTSIPEVVGEAALLCDPHNPQNIAENMYRGLTDQSLRIKLTALGLERVKSFGWEQCARETLEFFKNLK